VKTMKNTKEKKFYEIRCGRCGTCCIEPVVPVTDSDVARISKELSVPPQKFIRFYTMDEMDFNEDSEFWVNFPEGKMAMGLKKRNERCIFLSDTISCKVYEARPMTCRTFPYMIDFDENGDPESVKKNKIVDCKSSRKGLSPLDQPVSNVRIEMNEDEAYFEKVRLWNKRQDTGDTIAFLKYLKLL
jgi:Fe-S-cluster containining protein